MEALACEDYPKKKTFSPLHANQFPTHKPRARNRSRVLALFTLSARVMLFAAVSGNGGVPAGGMDSEAEKSAAKAGDPGPPADDLDILDIIGGDGRWQRRVFLTYFLILIPSAGFSTGVTFLAPDLDSWCARPPQAANLSEEEWKEFGLPASDWKCQRYEDLSRVVQKMHQNGTTVPCSSWEYDHSFYGSTLTSEWDLVCEREWLISLSKSVFVVGLLLGSVISGTLADKFGRRPPIMASIFLATVSSAACAFSSSYSMFIVFRFILALGNGGYIDNFFILLMEILDPSKRVLYGIVSLAGFPLGMIVLSGVAWFARDWHWIQLVLTGELALFLASWWVVSESPRWLLSKGKDAEAKAILIKAARENGRDISSIDEKVAQILSKTADDSEREGTILDLFATPSLRKLCSILFFAWMVLSFIFFGLAFNTNDWFGDPFANFALSGAVELPAALLAVLVVQRFGRKLPVALPLIVGGLVCLVASFISHDTVFSVVLALATRLCVACSYSSIYVYTAELLPTVLRTTGQGWAGVFEEIGAIVSPFVHEIGKYTASFVPFLVFGALGLTSGLLFLTMMPETRGHSIPDFVWEARDNANGSVVRRNSRPREPSYKEERC